MILVRPPPWKWTKRFLLVKKGKKSNQKTKSATNEEGSILFSSVGWLSSLTSWKEISSTPTLVAGGTATELSNQPQQVLWSGRASPSHFSLSELLQSLFSSEIAVKFISSTPTHTVLICPEFLTWYPHFSHQKILTGAWALCQLFKLILFLTVRILCIELHKDKSMLWNYLKQEEEEKKKKRQNFSISGLSNLQVT